MFRFTIRDVLWLTVLVSLGVALWVEQQARDVERKRATIWQLRAQAASLALEDANRQVMWEGSYARVVKPASSGKGKVTIIYQDDRTEEK